MNAHRIAGDLESGTYAIAGMLIGALSQGIATAYHRLVGTGIAAVSKEGCGILSGDAVESGSKCLLQRFDGARGDPPQIGFHLGPSGFDRAEVRAVGGQITIGKAGSIEHGLHPGESGEFFHPVMRLARNSSSHPAALRLLRKEFLPGALLERVMNLLPV
jgi:hypothetical protein